jgi:hypothetical protein
MHSLTALKKLFEENSIEVLSFNGMFLNTQHGKWSMARDEYQLDGKIISRKDIKKFNF